MFQVKQALWVTLLVGGPLVLFTMAVGLFLGFLQAIFQLQDQSFPFAIKMIGSLLLLIGIGPWMADTLLQYANMSFSMFSQV